MYPVEVLYVKTDSLFNITKKNKLSKEKKVTIGLIVTGILSLALVFVTIYGQFTGTFLVKVTYAAEQKGIILSEEEDFNNPLEKLVLNPIEDVDDILESNILRIDEILHAGGGHYEDPDGNDNYVAYNFYLKNTGTEVVDIRYDIRIVGQQNNLDKGATILLYEHDMDGTDHKKLVFEKDGEYNYLGGDKIINYEVGRIQKFTLIVFINGHRSDPSMLGGAVKVELIFSIETARKE